MKVIMLSMQKGSFGTYDSCERSVRGKQWLDFLAGLVSSVSVVTYVLRHI